MNIENINSGVLGAVGKTPLIKLQRFYENIHFNVFAKMEFLNPAGSMKDRVAVSLIEHGITTGKIDKDTTIIESSSGNMGIGLAMVCAYYGLRFICVVDKNISVQNLNILKTYGAKAVMIEEKNSSKYGMLQARLYKVNQLLTQIENSYWPCQYENEYNPRTHYKHTIEEIYSSLPTIDYIFIAVSTCGMLKGCLDYIDFHKKNTKVYAIDAVGSVIFGGNRGKRLLPGHGASLQPYFSKSDIMNKIEDCIRVDDYECIKGCRKLVKKEAIFAGASTGGVLMAIDKIKQNITQDANCVVIVADRGERYLDTVYSDHWVSENFDAYKKLEI